MSISSEQDLIDLIKKGVERPDLDYKDDIDLQDEKKAKVEITKDVIAIANSGGGVIVAGVKQTPKGFILTGMSAETLKAFDSTRLNDFVKNYSDPPINATTRIVTIDGKTFGVVLIPEFGEQPHIVIRDFPGVLSKGDLLVRTSSNSSEKASPHELRQLLDRAVTRRKGMMQELMLSVLKVNQPVLLAQPSVTPVAASVPFDRKKYVETYQGFRIAMLSPLGSVSGLRPIDLRKAIEKSAIGRETGSMVFPSAYSYTAKESRLPIGIAFETEYSRAPNRLFFSYFDVTGQAFDADSLWEDMPSNTRPSNSVGILSCYQMITASLLFGRQYFPLIGWEGQVRAKFSLESSTARSLLMDSNQHWPLSERYSNDMDIPVTVERVINTTDDLLQLEAVAVEMIQEFCWYFHFDLPEENCRDLLAYLKKQNYVIVPKTLALPPQVAG